MLEKMHINVNRQLQRMLYAMFDADKSGTISKTEFKTKLAPYTKKAEITVEQIADTGIKDKEELVEMYNEDIREKQVFEDFGFSPSDIDELKRREAETIELIKKGELPMEEIKGEIQIKLLNFENLTRVEGKPVVYYKIKRTFFNDENKEAPVVQFRKDKPGFMQKNFNWEQRRMDCRVNLNDLMNENLHLQGDTILIELYMIERAEVKLRKDATFVGELRFGYKHCFEEENKNQWKWRQVEISDVENKRKGRADELLSGQVNVEVRYQEAHLIKTRQNIPQELIRAEVKEDHMAQHVGAAGTLYIVPRMMVFAEASGLAFEPEPTLYGVRFSLENDPSRSITSEAGTQDEGPTCRWMDTRQLAVHDTLADKLLNCTVVKLTAIGEQDVPVAKGQVPEAKLAEIYAAVDVK